MAENIISEDIYKEILLEPPKVNPRLNNLHIVSGYATAAMAFHHLYETGEKKTEAKKTKKQKDASAINPVNVNLICGMPVLDGISLSNHEGFCKLVGDFSDRFKCSYIYKGMPVHSKVYIWSEGDTPKLAFLGSANYSQAAMCLKKRREVITPCSPTQAFKYYRSLINDSMLCTDSNVLNHLPVYADEKRKTALACNKNQVLDVDFSGMEHVKISLLSRNNVVPQKSGLNWGHRGARNRDEAYISLPSTVYNTNFFPPNTFRFTIRADDGKVLICVRAQDNAKAIHTTQDNSLMGAYFRRRLGLASGTFVTVDHLKAYGRTDIDFYKVDDETYYLDFSVTRQI